MPQSNTTPSRSVWKVRVWSQALQDYGWWNAEHQDYSPHRSDGTGYTKAEAEARAKEHGGVAVKVVFPPRAI